MQSLSRFGTTFLLLVTVLPSTLFAGGVCRSCCPKCNTPCVLNVEEGTETKHCWKLEEKTVCIPRVTFSWQWPFQKKKTCGGASCDQAGCVTCCKPPKIARSRTVCVLVKHEYECPVCKYTWEPKKTVPCESDCTETTAAKQSQFDGGNIAQVASVPAAMQQPLVPAVRVAELGALPRNEVPSSSRDPFANQGFASPSNGNALPIAEATPWK